jgi:hypothetical protein
MNAAFEQSNAAGGRDAKQKKAPGGFEEDEDVIEEAKYDLFFPCQF